MTSVLTNAYVDKLDDILNKYNNTYHSKIKMKPADVKASTYIDFKKENNKEDPKFEVGDHVRISNIKIILQKVSLQIGLQKFWWLKNSKYCSVDICY